ASTAPTRRTGSLSPSQPSGARRQGLSAIGVRADGGAPRPYPEVLRHFPGSEHLPTDTSPKGLSFTMKTWVRKSLNVGVLSAGFLLAAGSAAHANWTTANNGGAASGNQVGATAQAPISANNNAIGVLGFAQTSGGAGAASTSSAGA